MWLIKKRSYVSDQHKCVLDLSFGKTTLRMHEALNVQESISLLARILIMKKIPTITENTFERKSPKYSL